MNIQLLSVISEWNGDNFFDEILEKVRQIESFFQVIGSPELVTTLAQLKKYNRFLHSINLYKQTRKLLFKYVFSSWKIYIEYIISFTMNNDGHKVFHRA